MSIQFHHVPHPHIALRKKTGPAKTTDEHVGFNGKVALILTTVVGTMWCAYAFACLALVALPSAAGGGSSSGSARRSSSWSCSQSSWSARTSSRERRTRGPR